MLGEGTPGEKQEATGDKAVLREPGSQYRGCAAGSDWGLALSKDQGAGREGRVRGGGRGLGASSHSQLLSFVEAGPARHGPKPPICASGLLEGSQCGLSRAGKSLEAALGCMQQLSPGLFPRQAFWKHPRHPLPNLRGA